MIGAEAGVATDLREAAGQRVELRDPCGVAEITGPDREGHRDDLVEDLPFARGEGVAGWGAQHVHTGREEIHPWRRREAGRNVIAEPHTDGVDLGGEEAWIVGAVAG